LIAQTVQEISRHYYGATGLLELDANGDNKGGAVVISGFQKVGGQYSTIDYGIYDILGASLVITNPIPPRL